MSRASAFTPHHAQQMKDLRAWARKQGKTPKAVVSVRPEKLSPEAERERNQRISAALTSILGPSEQALAQDAASAPANPNPTATRDGEPAPDVISHD
jgi:hypothetical protein